MSGGASCNCMMRGSSIFRGLNWRVLQRNCNHSTFNGSHRTPSAYSEIKCLSCGRCWRTKAAYVSRLNDYIAVGNV